MSKAECHFLAAGHKSSASPYHYEILKEERCRCLSSFINQVSNEKGDISQTTWNSWKIGRQSSALLTQHISGTNLMFFRRLFISQSSLSFLRETKVAPLKSTNANGDRLEISLPIMFNKNFTLTSHASVYFHTWFRFQGLCLKII